MPKKISYSDSRPKEASARIKINKLLELAGWRFFDDESGRANIQLEPSVKVTKQALDELGQNFEKTSRGFADFLLLNEKGFPLIVLEAKAEGLNPLVGKEQARKYARSQNCRFVILSNGNLHYFWDLDRGNPYIITSFPTPSSVTGYQKAAPDRQKLVSEKVAEDYVVLTQRPGYATEAAWKNEAERSRFIEANKLRFLRPYQLKAIHAIQQSVSKGNDRFLLEMATGTGKTLTAAAIIKLFLRTGNAHRVLFLVDRLELEEQAVKAFRQNLANDFKAVIYKENRDDWRHAEIVVTTVQSLLFGNKYQRLFSPTDFDLVISDEAHRSIGGNARAVIDNYRPHIPIDSQWPMVEIGEICNLINGRAFKPTDWQRKDSGGLPIVRIQNLNNPEAPLNYYTGTVAPQHLIEPAELLFSWSGSRGTSFGAHIWWGERAVLNQHIFKVQFPADRANKAFLLHILNAAVEEVEDNLHGGVGLVHITKGNLERIKIPLPTLTTQRAIVAEIEAEQVLVAANRELIARMEKKIQATLARVWGDTPAAEPAAAA